MCGISGFIAASFSKTDLERMTTAIKHRGPDAAGYYYNQEKSIGLGHRRLSIIDLSDAANQPLYTASKRYVIVFNGEIYNYLDLKAKYQIATKTNSDTEIILALYEKIGIDCFNEFNGMFAIAIWDNDENKLIIARDRVGKKPVYFSHQGNEFAFASELKSLIALKKQKPDLSHLPIYLHLGYMPSTYTFYQNVQKLKAGHLLIWQHEKYTIQPFWSIDPFVLKNSNITEQGASKKLEEIIETSVAYRLIADVPLGSFLSGGIDSSLVTAIAQKQKSSAIKTFSIGFKESKFNESVYAKKVADHLKTDHHEFILSVDDAKSKVVELIDIYDEPYTDSSSIPTLLVSEMARKHVTVALSGDGGDELFMGYGMYDWAQRLSEFPYSNFHNLLGKCFELLGNSRFKRIGDLLQFNSDTYIPAHIFSQEQYLFSKQEIDSLLLNQNKSNMFNANEFGMDTISTKLSPAETQSIFDLKNYLQEDLMVKVDRASMYHSLETRAPLLDYRLVEFAFSLPHNLRKKEKVAKYLLKQLLYKHVPKEIFDRPKWGFSIPLGTWLQNDLNFLIQKYLSKEVLENYQIVNPIFVGNLIQRFTKGEVHLYNRLWSLILLHQWLIKLESQN